MNPVDNKILEFIHEHHVLTLATSSNNKPYCCTLFYVFSNEENMFVFSSDVSTTHGKHLTSNPFASGAIALETSIIGKIQGLQFTGAVDKLEGDAFKKAEKMYTRKFPVAHLTKLTLWGIRCDYMKFTDNRLGFGKKITWEKEPVRA